MGKASRTKNTVKPVKITEHKDRFGLWVTLAVILIVAVFATIIIFSNLKNQELTAATASKTTPAGVMNDGVVITKNGVDTTLKPYKIGTEFKESPYTSEKNNITVYMDYSCPHCADFETANSDSLSNWLQDGTIDTLTIHPVAFLNEYSLIGANAFMCTAEADPKNALNAHYALTEAYQNPQQGKQLLNLIAKSGTKITPELEKCVRGNKYEEFIFKATEKAQKGPIPQADNNAGIKGTPTILVNGKQYTNNPADKNAFATFVKQTLAGETESDLPDNTIQSTPTEEKKEQ